MSIFRKPRPGILPVSPPDEPEMPDEYIDKARAELRADLDWCAGEIAELVDSLDVVLLMQSTDDTDRQLCDRLRSVVNTAIEREAPDRANDLWQRDIDDSRQAAAEYAADLSDY